MVRQLGKTNGKYRDRLFKFIFGNPDNKKWTLSLYNAVNGSDYTNEDAITYNTLKDAIFMNMKNDMSFIIENNVNLYEHQSTYCPNMPLRFLWYLSKLYESYSQKDRFNVHSTSIQRIPRPRCVCFYNGRTPTEDVKILHLSDMYFENTNKEIENSITSKSIVELDVVMINVNYGHNKELLRKCKPLYEYSFFIDRIRFHVNKLKETGETYSLEDAIFMAIDNLPKDFEILEFILSNRTEVKDMCLFEYDQEKHMRYEREEGIEEGMAKGIEEGMAKGITKGQLIMLMKLVNRGKLTLNEAVSEVGMNVNEFQKVIQTLQAENTQVENTQTEDIPSE